MRRRLPVLPALGPIACTLALSVAAAASSPLASAAPPPSSLSATVPTEGSGEGSVPPTLEQATDRALKLEELVEEIRADRVALETRIRVTNERIFRQQEVLVEAAARLQEARRGLSERFVAMYKSTAMEPVSLLLSAESLGDLFRRMAFLARIAEIDNRALRDAVVAAAEADYQAAALEDLKAQDVTLRALLRQREADLVRARDEQNALVAKLTAQERERLRAYRAKRAKTRQAWRESSIPAGRPVPTAQAVVEPYADRTYLVAAYQPRRYRTTGETYTAVCSWYGNEFDGRPTASGQIFNQNDLTCASRGLAFGTRLALTRGGRGVIVVVNDRGPFIAGRDLDLSRAAARALGFSGVERVHVEVVTALE